MSEPTEAALRVVVRHLLADLPLAEQAAERLAALVLVSGVSESAIVYAANDVFPERITRVKGSDPERFYYDNKKVRKLRDIREMERAAV